MHRLKTIALEIYSLFVDDGPFALAILLWLAVASLLLPKRPAGQQGILLAGGLVLLLAVSTWRAATRTRR
jgi:hypothetical protein